MAARNFCLERKLTILADAEATRCKILLSTCFNGRASELLQQIREEAACVDYNISFCHLALGDATNALAAADSAVTANPRFAKAHTRQALALEKLGRPAWAAADTVVLAAETNEEAVVPYAAIRQRHCQEEIDVQAPGQRHLDTCTVGDGAAASLGHVSLTLVAAGPPCNV